VQDQSSVRLIRIVFCRADVIASTFAYGFDTGKLVEAFVDLAAHNLLNLGARPARPPEVLVSPEPTASHEAIEIGRSARRGKIAGFAVSATFAFLALAGGFPAPVPLFLLVAAIASFFLVRNLVDRSNAAQAYTTAFQAASSSWSSTEQEWQVRTRTAPFDEKKVEFTRVKDQLSQLPVLLNQRIQQLKNDQQRIQLEKFLDRFEIEDANIEGIGKGRKQTLASYGIETAADLDSKLHGVPGFGPKLTKALMSWRDGLIPRFRFDPARGIDPNDVAKINNEIALLRRDLEQRLVGGLAQLKQIRSHIVNTRTQFIDPVRSVYREFLQAEANLAAAQGKLR
jgi:hypothetical protein